MPEHGLINVLNGSLNKCMINTHTHMKSSDAKASKCHLKFSSLMMIFYQTWIFKFSDFT